MISDGTPISKTCVCDSARGGGWSSSGGVDREGTRRGEGLAAMLRNKACSFRARKRARLECGLPDVDSGGQVCPLRAPTRGQLTLAVWGHLRVAEAEFQHAAIKAVACFEYYLICLCKPTELDVPGHLKVHELPISASQSHLRFGGR